MGKQFVVQVDDRPGALSHMLHVLAMRGINIQQLAGAGAGVAGLVVLTVSDDEAARKALHGAGYTFSEGESLIVRVDDRPGALAEVADVLAAAGVNVHSVLEVGRHRGRVALAFTVDDLAKAQAALGDR